MNGKSREHASGHYNFFNNATESRCESSVKSVDRDLLLSFSANFCGAFAFNLKKSVTDGPMVEDR